MFTKTWGVVLIGLRNCPCIISEVSHVMKNCIADDKYYTEMFVEHIFNALLHCIVSEVSHVAENHITDDDDTEMSCILYIVLELSHVIENHFTDNDKDTCWLCTFSCLSALFQKCHMLQGITLLMMILIQKYLYIVSEVSNVTENYIADDENDTEMPCILYFVSEVSHVTENNMANDDNNTGMSCIL